MKHVIVLYEARHRVCRALLKIHLELRILSMFNLLK